MADNLDYLEIEEILLCILLKRRRRRRYKGVYTNLLRECNVEDPECFRQFHRLDRESCFSVGWPIHS